MSRKLSNSTTSVPQANGSALDVESIIDTALDGSGGDPVRVVRTRAKERRAEKRHRRITWGFAGLTVAFIAALGVLTVVGWRTTMQITGGADVRITDPEAPGYTADASSTDVQLLGLTDVDGALAVSLMLLGGAGTDHVSVVPLSSEMVVWDFDGAPPQATRVVYADAGVDVLTLRLGADLGFGFTSTSVVPISIFEPLYDKVGPVTLDLPDVVYHNNDDGTREIHYPAGEMTLTPDQFTEFLSYTDNNEGELNRALRVNPLWEKLIAAYVEDPAVLGAPDDSGIELSLWDQIAGRDVAEESPAAGTPTVEILPTEMIPMYVNPPASVSRIDQVAIPSWIADHVPFPIPAFPGQRLIVSLLNGTTDKDVLRTVSPLVVAADGSIGLTGNAMSSDVEKTMVEYSSDGNADGARRMADQFGTVATRIDLLPSGVDVQVTIGRDQT